MNKYQILDQQGYPIEGFIIEANYYREFIQIMLDEGKCFPGWSFEEIKEENNIPKIVNLKQNTKYKKTLSKLINQLNSFSDKIRDNLFNLACQGKWKEWDKAQPIGTEFYVDEEMLRNTGDKNIDLLWEVLDKIEEVKEKIPQIEEELKILLIPKDPDDDKNIICEIRAGAGGDEAALFAGTLYRMYSMYADTKHWKVDILNENETGLRWI